jgi:dienelactone hydrolase
MTYDPFSRGPWPVGVRTLELRDPANRPLVTELWYPAAARHRGEDGVDATRDAFTVLPSMPVARQDARRDAAPAPVESELVVYCHGGYGHRREATNLTTHLASHGYVVVAPDFPGDQIADVMPASLGGTEKVASTPVDDSAVNRPGQAVAAADGSLDAIRALGIEVRPTRFGATGISMGGYTALAVNSRDRRFSASFAMCPMYGSRSPLPQIARLQRLLTLDDWAQRPDVFVLAAELDPYVMLEDLRELHARLPAPKRLAVLKRGGHLHFADNAEASHEMYRKAYLSGEFPDPDIDAIALGTAMRPFSELVSEADAHATARALLLAQMDSVLRGDAAASAFLDRGLGEAFAARGIALEVV